LPTAIPRAISRPFGAYTITETKAPNGFQLIAPIIVSVGESNPIVQISATDHSQHTITIHKQDRQSGVSLQGVTFRFEQIDGSFKTDATKQSVKWDGSADVTLTFTNVRKTGFKILKVDAVTGRSLPGATPDPVLTITDEARPSLIILKYDEQTGKPIPDSGDA
jgi:uncharacterized surface anchored protein